MLRSSTGPTMLGQRVIKPAGVIRWPCRALPWGPEFPAESLSAENGHAHGWKSRPRTSSMTARQPLTGSRQWPLRGPSRHRRHASDGGTYRTVPAGDVWKRRVAMLLPTYTGHTATGSCSTTTDGRSLAELLGPAPRRRFIDPKGRRKVSSARCALGLEHILSGRSA